MAQFWRKLLGNSVTLVETVGLHEAADWGNLDNISQLLASGQFDVNIVDKVSFACVDCIS